MMKNTNFFDLELRLRPSFDDDDDSDLSVSYADESSVHQHAETTQVSSEKPEQQQITIFCNGKVSVSEVTEELQARAIIMLASRDGFCQRTRLRTSTLGEQSSKLKSPTPTGLSMKRSLRRFFQNRHQRIQHSSSPYSRHRSQAPMPLR